jgi:hypothetical protein
MKMIRLPRMKLWSLAAIVAYTAILLRILQSPVFAAFVDQWGQYCRTAAFTGVLAGGVCFILSFAIARLVSCLQGSTHLGQEDVRSSNQFGRWLYPQVARQFATLSPRTAGVVIGLAWSGLLSILLCVVYKWLYFDVFCGVLGLAVVLLCFAVFSVDAKNSAQHFGACLRAIGLLFAWLPRLAFGSSPTWFRIILAWTLAELSVPSAHFLVSLSWYPDDYSDPWVWFLVALLFCLGLSLSILLRGIYDLCRPLLSTGDSLCISIVLGYVSSFLFFRFSGHL